MSVKYVIQLTITVINSLRKRGKRNMKEQEKHMLIITVVVLLFQCDSNSSKVTVIVPKETSLVKFKPFKDHSPHFT